MITADSGACVTVNRPAGNVRMRCYQFQKHLLTDVYCAARLVL